jgi:hypothetical protein
MTSMTSMTPKAQLIGQIFIFIMAALIIGVIILIGYNAISGTLSKSCQIEQISFKTKLESLIDRSNGWGSVTKQSLIAPCHYETVCFVDATKIGSALSQCADHIINASSKDGDMKNVFVSTSTKTVPIGYAPMLRLNNTENCTCISQKNKNFYITFVGKGSGTYLFDTSVIGNRNVRIDVEGNILLE